MRNLGGHDLAALRRAFQAIDDTRPTVVLAYTLKGYGLATEGHPQNHSALLTEAQVRLLAEQLGADLDDPWARPAAGSAAARLLEQAAARLDRGQPAPPAVPAAVPQDLGRTPTGTGTTQAALGRTLLDLNRAAPEVGRRVVTVSPDVSSSTNLGGWVNKVGVWAASERDDWFADDPETVLHWRERPEGQHVELGIAETNLVGLMGELGATWSRWSEPLLPIGVMYDPFVERALEPWSFGLYAGRPVDPRGHAVRGDARARRAVPTSRSPPRRWGSSSRAARRTSRPSRSTPSGACSPRWPGWAGPTARRRTCGCRPGRSRRRWRRCPTDPAARERRRRQVVAGAYLLRRAADPAVTLVAMGAVVPEALAAADRLADGGLRRRRRVRDLAGLLFRAVQARRGLDDASTAVLVVGPAGRARAADGDRARRPPAHAGVPGRRARGAGRPPRA